MKTAPLHRPLVAALLGLALGGCHSAGPDYQRPSVALPLAYRNAPPVAAVALSAPADEWWKVFNDPVLDELQAAAVAHAPTLQAALAARDAALARRGVDRAARLPAASGGLEAQLAGESVERTVITPRGYDQVRERGDSYRLSVAAGYEFDLWGRVRRLTEHADAQVAASESDLAAVRLTLAGDVAASYFRLRSNEAEATVLTQRHAAQREGLALRKSRQAAGFTSDIEVARDEAELHTLAADLSDVRRRIELERNILVLLTGRGDTPSVAAPVSRPSIPAGVPAGLLARRPDVAAAEAQLRIRTAEIGIAQAARYPTVQLTANGGFASAELGDLFERPAQFWGVGPSLSVPLFDGGRGKSQVAAARAAAQQAEAAFRQQLLVACREVEDALVEGRGLAEREAAQHAAREAAAEVLRLTTVRHDRGLVSYFEVLSARRSLLDIDRSLALLEGQRQLAAVRLIRALGGTWNS